MMKFTDYKDFLAHVNKQKIFNINYLYQTFEAHKKSERKKIKEILKKLVKKGYLKEKSGGVYIPVFKKDQTVGEVIGYKPPKDDFYEVCTKFSIKPTFPFGVIKEAEKVAFIPPLEIEKRMDLRAKTIITIDGADAKDLDDAVSLEMIGENYRLGVHIADVSYYVREQSELDKEAYARGTSIYLVDRVIPMLPKVISNGICSLSENEDKLTLSAFIVLDQAGAIVSYEIAQTIIRSCRRYTYDEVHAIVRDNALFTEKDKELQPLLVQMDKLAQILRRKRFQEGAIDFDVPEVKIILDAKSRPIEIKPVKRLLSHELIEEFMLSANKVVAMFLEENKTGIFRVHESPTKEKIEQFVKIASFFEDSPKIFNSSLDIQRYLEKIKGHPESYVLNTLLLRSMQQAYYHHENFGHYGLSFTHYTHFTSPIRRYPDLLVHRAIKQLKKYELDSKHISSKGFLAEAAAHSSKQERVAVDMERAMEKRKFIHYLKHHLDEEFDGTVSGVQEFGVFVALKNIGAEGMITRNLLSDFKFEEELKIYTGQNNQLRLGKKVRIKVLSLNLKRELVDFGLVKIY